MTRDPWIPAMLGLAYLGIVWLLCQLWRIGWLYLCALTCWLLEWWDNRRDRIARKLESDAYGTAEAARRQSLSTMARTVREDRRPLDERVSADLARRREETVIVFHGFEFNHDERSDWTIPQSDPVPQSGSHRVSEGGVVSASEFGGHTRLTLGGGDKAA